MLTKFFGFMLSLSPGIKKNLWHWWYQLLAKRHRHPSWLFMNYGYENLDESLPTVVLEDQDEKDRYFIQLYHHVASVVDASGKDVLEVGSGRGGGCSYAARYLKPKRMVGLDLSENAVAFSKTLHGDIPNLEFHTGDAENIPFEENSFDAVINVESSHCYPAIEQFFAEVHRVLKPGGIFSWADLREIEKVGAIEDVLKNLGFELLSQKTITENVLKALDFFSDTKESAIHEHIPKFIQKPFKDFSGVKDTRIYNAFKSGRLTYLSKVAKKNIA